MQEQRIESLKETLKELTKQDHKIATILRGIRIETTRVQQELEKLERESFPITICERRKSRFSQCFQDERNKKIFQKLLKTLTADEREALKKELMTMK